MATRKKAVAKKAKRKAPVRRKPAARRRAAPKKEGPLAVGDTFYIGRDSEGWDPYYRIFNSKTDAELALEDGDTYNADVAISMCQENFESISGLSISAGEVGEFQLVLIRTLSKLGD